jgi:hypothetical protein
VRKRHIVVSLAACAAAASGAIATATAGAAAQPSGPQSARVIVVLKNQERSLPATPQLVMLRRRTLAQMQAPLRAQMVRSGAQNIHTYTLINAISATVSPAEEARLRANPAVSEVIPDELISLSQPQGTGAQAGPASATVTGPHANVRGVCSTDGRPQLNPQALELIHADSDVRGAKTARSLGFTGAGVKVAFIADGLNINDKDFIRPDGQHVIVAFKDFTGEGTAVPTGGEEAFGDASSIAAQGRVTYNVRGYSPDAVTESCPIRIEGVAPGASVVALDVFGAENAGYSSSIIQAVDYAVTVQHVNVLNESFGNNYYPDDSADLDLIKAADDAAVAAGTTVTVSSGDAGPTSTLGTPGTDPKVIEVGATTSYRLDIQAGYGGAQFPGVRGYLNNNISSFSSGGFIQQGRTLDLVAPGELGWALCSSDVSQWAECTNYSGKPSNFVAFGGTSESAPLTAGTAALVIQAYRRTHYGSTPSPALVKQFIVSTAQDIGAPADQQGAGLLDAYRAVLAAESYRVSRRAGDELLFGATQLNATEQPGTRTTFADTITNDGAARQTVSLHPRTLGSYTTIHTQTVQLSDTNSPHTIGFLGEPANYEPIRFTVPRNENRLSASIAFKVGSPALQEDDLNARVRLTLIGPGGALAAYSVPQGDGNYGNVQIADPAAGTWTAYVWSREGADGGTQGLVKFGAAVARYTGFGTVSPDRFTLRPGQSRRVTLTVRTPSQPGDAAGAIVVDERGATSTIPVTLRSLVPLGRESFTGVLSGGNGRSVITGQTFYYQLNLPAGEPELNATVKLANNPNNPFTAFLVSPSGEALATASNTVLGSTGPVQQIGAQLHVVAPAAGRWTLIIAFIPFVSGNALSEPFTVTTDQSPSGATASGLPDTTTAMLPAGQAQTATITVTNHGPEPELYFLDARLPRRTTRGLVATCSSPTPTGPCNTTTVPLIDTANIPLYVVPPETTKLSEQASTTGTTPIQFDSAAPLGDPDIPSTQGSTVSATLNANQIAQGVWDIAPDVVGPFGSTGVANEQVSTAASVTTLAFDTDVSSPTGDLWEASVGLQSLSAFNPVVANPGQTVRIPLTITPSQAPGTRVSGTVYLDDVTQVAFGQLSTLVGDQLAAFPYAYRVASPAGSAGTTSNAGAHSAHSHARGR